jgi:hypothetical protein
MTNVKLSEKQKEVINGNKLIAEFDGWKYSKSGKTVRKTANPNSPYRLKDIQYHSSWAWLMPVVEKIEKEDFGFKMCRKVVEVYRDSTKEVILKTKQSCRLDSLYAAVVAFIKWHKSLPLQ